MRGADSAACRSRRRPVTAMVSASGGRACRCPNCSAMNAPDAAFCGRCGQPLPPRKNDAAPVACRAEEVVAALSARRHVRSAAVRCLAAVASAPRQRWAAVKAPASARGREAGAAGAGGSGAGGGGSATGSGAGTAAGAGGTSVGGGFGGSGAPGSGPDVLAVYVRRRVVRHPADPAAVRERRPGRTQA